MGIYTKFKTIEAILTAFCACAECDRSLVCVFFTVSIDGVQSDQTALWVRFDWISRLPTSVPTWLHHEIKIVLVHGSATSKLISVYTHKTTNTLYAYMKDIRQAIRSSCANMNILTLSKVSAYRLIRKKKQ